MIDDAWKETGEKAWEWLKNQEYDPESIQDDDEVRRLYLEVWLGERGYDVYRLYRTGLCTAVGLTEWLREQGFDPSQVLPLKTLPFAVPAQEFKDCGERLSAPVAERPWVRRCSRQKL